MAHMAQTTQGQVITFYSYKGGAGRTMALANAATLLARDHPRKVLVMDWDLEAPGLHRFFAPETDSDAAPRRGTIDLLEKLDELTRTSASPKPLDEPATLELIKGIALDSYLDTTIGSSPIDLLRAGWPEDESYAERLTRFDWDALYERAPYLFKALAAILCERYRYVLIDSRTGLSDTSGICTALLPEKLVLVFTPNRQSLDGALARARAAVTYRRQADDLRPLVIYPLASRVELSEEDLRQRWRHGDGESKQIGYQPAFEQVFHDIYDLPTCDLRPWFDEVQIQHSPRHAYGEAIAVVEERGATTDRLSLAHSYSRFTQAIQRAPAPWELEREPDTQVEADLTAERVAMVQLEQERDWHDRRAAKGRQMLFIVRVYQLIIIVAAVVGAVTVGRGGVVSLIPFLVGGCVAVLAFEAFAMSLGYTQWQRHAYMSSALEDEKYRYDTRTRHYKDTVHPGELLAERVDDILSGAYRNRDSGIFGSLAPARPRTGSARHDVDIESR
jgi:cellulose biosynthesis protein BcsQ